MKVFISFSSKEQDRAEEVCKFLETNGISCFISSRDLIPGEEYARQLVDNMDSADAVVLVMSKAANESPHVLREIEHAVSHRITILVYPIEEVVLSKSMEYFLMAHQWIRGESSQNDLLLEGLRHLETIKEEGLEHDPKRFLGDETDGPMKMPSSRGESPKKSIKVTKKGIAVSFVIVLAVAIIIAGGIFTTKAINRIKYKKAVETLLSNIKPGDEVNFGSYDYATIEWRVLKVNDDRTMVLVSKDIIAMKVFDSAEGGEYNMYDGADYYSYANHDVSDEDLLLKIRGNNDWAESNIRTWLNSTQEEVYYADRAPSMKAAGSNAYDTEEGFLHTFTEEELALIVPTINETRANSHSENVKDGMITTTDLIYLLSSDELSMFKDAKFKMYAAPSWSCQYEDENVGTYEQFRDMYNTDNYYWWLRDNAGDKINEVYLACTEVEDDVKFVPQSVGAYPYGVRPAVTVKMDSEYWVDEYDAKQLIKGE